MTPSASLVTRCPFNSSPPVIDFHCIVAQPITAIRDLNSIKKIRFFFLLFVYNFYRDVIII
jgi:hypothetical protein